MSEETAQDAEVVEAFDDGAIEPLDEVGQGPEGEGEVTDEAVESAPGGPSLEDLPAALEAVLLVVDEPVNEVLLAQVLEHPTDVVVATLRELASDYDNQGRGFELREVAGGWRFYSREEHAPWVEKFVLDGQAARLTQAALETLAVVAYRQPVSRGRVSAVRGVNVDGVMRTLLTRGLVEEVGSEHETGAILYGTSTYFLERLGLKSLDELPELAPYLPELDTLDLDSEHLQPIGSDV
jgi:segregation and condensation protein B